jgi:beta-ribofuranosylaminobenzene 5'-phosphate synthase
MIQITAFPRIHICLLSMHEGGYRKNGGLGFAIDLPSYLVTCEISANRSLSYDPKCAISERDLTRLAQAIDRTLYTAKDRNIGYDIRIAANFKSHIGLGNGTALTLACCEAVSVCNRLNLSDAVLVGLSERGGASGIGIETYFHGGFVFDLGIKASESTFRSSEDNIPTRKKPLTLTRQQLSEWKVGVCIPKKLESISYEEESTFFKETCPLPAQEVYQAIHEALFGCLAGVIEHDFDVFCEAINALQRSTWKAKEIKLHGTSVVNLRECILEAGAKAVGMSSFGPVLYFFAHDLTTVMNTCIAQIPDCDFFVAGIRNNGRTISHA